MASVRMTKELIENIRNQAYQLFDKNIKKTSDTLDATFYTRLLNEVHKAKIAIYNIEQFPNEWKIQIEGLHGKISGTIDGIKKKWSVNKQVDTSLMIPHIGLLLNYNRYYEFGTYECSESLFKEYDKYTTRCDKAVQERSEFVHEVVTIASRCNTLKQFLDAWPQGESLLDPAVIRKLHEKPKKREKLVCEDGEDITMNLSSVLIKRTITNQN